MKQINPSLIKYNIKRALLEGVFSQTEKKGREESLKKRLIILISTFNTTNLKNQDEFLGSFTQHTKNNFASRVSQSFIYKWLIFFHQERHCYLWETKLFSQSLPKVTTVIMILDVKKDFSIYFTSSPMQLKCLTFYRRRNKDWRIRCILEKIRINLKSHGGLVFWPSVSGKTERWREPLSNKSQKSEQDNSLS